ncbi:Interferon-induced very large GTPase 1 [Acipenser ruthenus]|uniref:Interferon-induced very large GTPase 1 n=1 Tax=Acipenser ruthenus TaxID=7906 RepID=A0A444UXS4_ACIRT|nr:Interferon-induced very large GTPase 1 [Acipenser ruthenus]
MEEEDNTVQNELVQELKNVGLDPGYWIQVLRNNLEVTNLKALKYLNTEEYANLENHAQELWEKQALQKLFGIQGMKMGSKELEAKRLDSLKKRQEWAKQALNDIETMQKKSEDQNVKEKEEDPNVKEKEEDLRLALQVPKDSWVPFGQPLEDIIKNMHKQLHLLDDFSHCSTEKLSDEDVLKNASGGLCLEGVYKTQNIEDMLEKREQIIDIPESFSLFGPEQNSFFEQKLFSSDKAKSVFHKAMENLGLSITCSAKTGFGGVSLENRTDKNKSCESEETSKLLYEQSYLCSAKYNYVPLASSFIELKNLKLSIAALEELKQIEKTLLNPNDDEFRNKVVMFFKRFGSHANQGPIHFGGVFWWTTTCKGFSSSELTQIKTLMSDALSSYIGDSYCNPYFKCAGGYASQLKEHCTGNYSESDLNKIELSVSKTGGAVETNNYLQWKTSLSTSRKTWCVIDRGFNLIPVWEIIMSSHRKDFKDALKLSSSLAEAYTITTKQNTDMLWGDNLLTSVQEAQNRIECIKNWTVSNSRACLSELLKLKTDLNEETGMDATWFNTCLSDQILQDFLEQVVKEHEPLSSSETKTIRMLMQCLLEPHVFVVKNFPKRKSIMKWAYETDKDIQERFCGSELKHLEEILKAKQNLKDVTFAVNSSETMHEEKIKATCKATLSLYSLCNTLRETNQNELEVLLLSIVTALGYCTESKACCHLLGWMDIERIEREVLNAYEKYCYLKAQNAARAQAYLLLTALTVSRDGKNVSPKEKGRRLEFITSQLKENISSKVICILKCSCGDWEILEKELDSFVTGSTIESNIQPKEMVKDLEMALVLQKLSTSEHRMEPIQSDISTENTDKFWKLLETLGLHNYYPKKMKKMDILIIDDISLHAKQPATEKELAHHFLYRLTMLDYSARSVVCKEEQTKSSGTGVEEQCTADDIDDFLSDATGETREDVTSHIHPMDIQMSIVLCANDFLRQYIFTKCSMCQYALPLLIPDPFTGKVEFPLWSLRQIKKSWQYKETSEMGSTVKCKSSSILNNSVPIVSFIRFDTSSTSKSQILNNVISKHKHNIFFHRNCRGSSKDCLLMEGVVEVAWYYPGGKDDDIFENCVAFTNLHGDACQHQKQLEFLQEVSAVNIVLLSGSPLNQTAKKIMDAMYKSPVPLVCLFADKERVASGKGGMKVKIAVKNRNETELTDQIISNIRVLLATQNKMHSLNTCSDIARKLGFVMDEDDAKCKEGKDMAQTLMCILKEGKLATIKEKLLPLQGVLWHAWCKKDKELYRLQGKANKSIEVQREEIRVEKLRIRNQQLKSAYPCNDLMKTFFECLSSPDSEETKLYFLQWLNIYLNDLTTDKLLKLQESYHCIWTEMRSNQKSNNELEAKQQSELDKISQEMNASAFGLHHLLREISQMYEAAEIKQCVNTLPGIGADMLISGYPIELMDGDAAHVPVEWIGAILDSLTDKLGEKKIFVLSVLGIQSSGKSTLLNAMFGLQFTVSAGRCTRGAFMQLVKVDEQIREKLQFDFVLVVDTEGLRSPELNNKSLLNHDNELATFIIGIGDMTVINIMGENPCEMQDILQICVQAFLRMKKVKLSPSCLFVHQNVADASASDSNMEGRRRLQERLDEMARIAAKHEQCDVNGFNDIIQFDVKTQVHYFKNLLEGDPPMAAPNPTYSQNVQELKNKLLTIADWKPECRFASISELKVRIQDLWNALLGENFVFSFKNTLEIMIYSKLEDKYAKWEWQLRKSALELQNRLRNAIASNMLQAVNKSIIEKEFEREYNSTINEIQMYFNEEEHQELLIQWKGNTEKRIEAVKYELVDEIKKKCNELIRHKESRLKLDQKKSEYETELLKRSKALASKLQDKKLSKEEVEKAFQGLWDQWISSISKQKAPDQPVDIDAQVNYILREAFRKHSDSDNKIDSSKGFSFDIEKHIHKKSRLLVLSRHFSNKDEQHVTDLTKRIQSSAKGYIDKKEEEKVDFSSSFIHEILNKTGNKILKFDESVKDFKLTDDYRIDLAVDLCRNAAARFKTIHEAFKKANDPLSYLESKRNEYYDIFDKFCQVATSITFFADLFCKKLKPAIRQAIFDEASIQITDKIKSNHLAFNGNRSNLENYILKHLAEKEEFDLYKEYIDRPKDYFQRYIRESVENYFEKHQAPIMKILNGRLVCLTDCVVTTIAKVTEEIEEKHGNAKEWLDGVCSQLGTELQLPRDDFESIENEDIKDITFLKEVMTESLRALKEDLKKEIANMHPVDRKCFRNKPDEILVEDLSGCWEQCPFCKAVCTNTIPDHNTDHSVRFHRPMALASWSYRNTESICIEICSTSVSSDRSFYPRHDSSTTIPWKKYREAGTPYDKWSITQDNCEQGYWKWFICRFSSEIEAMNNKKFDGHGEIPKGWKAIEKSSILKELL